WYVASLLAATLVGIRGDLDQLFAGAVPLTLMVYALLLFVLLRTQRQPIGMVLAAGFACWSVWLTQQLHPAYLLVASFGLAGLGWACSRLWRSEPGEREMARLPVLLTVVFPLSWYVASLLAATLVGIRGDLAQLFAGAVPLTLMLYALLLYVLLRTE